MIYLGKIHLNFEVTQALIANSLKGEQFKMTHLMPWVVVVQIIYKYIYMWFIFHKQMVDDVMSIYIFLII